MFTRHYEQVQAEAMRVWRLQYYGLLQEYRARLSLPAPLVLLELMYHLVVHLWTVCCRRTTAHFLRHAGTHRLYRQRHENMHPERLEHFQERQTERWARD